MPDDTAPTWPPPLVRWTWTMTLGWLLGFAILLLLVMLWGLTGLESQWMVGVGMSAGVALLQARHLAPAGIHSRRWVVASILAMGLPFVIWDVSRVMAVPLIPGLAGAAVIGAVLVGVVQGRMLFPRGAARAWWLLATVCGWILPVAVLQAGDAPALGAFGGVIATAAMFLGGSVLGVTTGAVLSRWPPSPVDRAAE